MSEALDFAKYFIKHGLDTVRNTFDGNMKLQKLLVFANLVSLAERGEPLFDDEILAFSQGCVIEKVRLQYKSDCAGLVADSENYNPEFSPEVYEVLNLVASIFGRLSARELSDVNHSFEFWRRAYNNSIQEDGYKDKSKAVVSVDDIKPEIAKVRQVVEAFRNTQNSGDAREIINGIEFYYSPSDFTFTDDMLDDLFAFSLSADDSAYSVYLDSGNLVVY